jgi:hypothetical protein
MLQRGCVRKPVPRESTMAIDATGFSQDVLNIVTSAIPPPDDGVGSRVSALAQDLIPAPSIGDPGLIPPPFIGNPNIFIGDQVSRLAQAMAGTGERGESFGGVVTTLVQDLLPPSPIAPPIR